MSTLIVTLHAIAAILLIGPVAVATSMYAPQFRKAQSGDQAALGAVRLLAGITRTYGIISLLVPLLGFGSMFLVDGAWKNYYFHAAILLAVLAWAVLIFLVIPTQRLGQLALGDDDPAEAPASDKEKQKLAALDVAKIPGRAAMFAGIFNLLWLLTALMMFL